MWNAYGPPPRIGLRQGSYHSDQPQYLAKVDAPQGSTRQDRGVLTRSAGASDRAHGTMAGSIARPSWRGSLRRFPQGAGNLVPRFKCRGTRRQRGLSVWLRAHVTMVPRRAKGSVARSVLREDNVVGVSPMIFDASVARVAAPDVEGEYLRAALDAVFEVGQQSLVREIEWVRVFPVVSGHLVQPIHDVSVAHFDRQLPPAVETPGREVD